jgi:hypothetical protein
MIDLKGRESKLNSAKSFLKIASTQVYSSASGLEPFEVSKILNVMGKELSDYSRILGWMLGYEKIEDVLLEFPSSPVGQIFEKLREDEK